MQDSRRWVGRADEPSACAFNGVHPSPGKLQLGSDENHSQLTGVRTVALIIPPEFAAIAVELRNDLDPDPWYITFGVATADPDPTLEGMAEKIAALWDSTFGPFMHVSSAQTAVQITLGVADEEPIRAFIPNEPNRGGSAQAKLPQNCAMLVRKSTAKGGRRNQGRFFIPGILDESDVSNTGVIVGSAVATYQTVANDFLTGLSDDDPVGSSIPMCLLHAEGISDTPSPTIVNRLTVDTTLSTQRRRLR
jgi:hypothetical protein